MELVLCRMELRVCFRVILFLLGASYKGHAFSGFLPPCKDEHSCESGFIFIYLFFYIRMSNLQVRTTDHVLINIFDTVELTFRVT